VRAVRTHHRQGPAPSGCSARAPAALARLDKFDAVVLDDLGYARKDYAETAVLFELIAESYTCERRSLVITCNQPFGTWETIFLDKVMRSLR
jgi:DNA replication protein DnaC